MNKRIPITVYIKKNSTGQIIKIDEETRLNDEGVPCDFIWSDGNYACDCNRALFFDGSDIPCSSGLYSIRLARKDNGEIFYDEFYDGLLEE